MSQCCLSVRLIFFSAWPRMYQRALPSYKGPFFLTQCSQANRFASLCRSCQSCDTWGLYNINRVTAHSQDDRHGWKKSRSGLWTNLELQKKAQVRVYLDMHLQPMHGHSVWKETLNAQGHRSVEVLLKKRKKAKSLILIWSSLGLTSAPGLLPFIHFSCPLLQETPWLPC